MERIDKFITNHTEYSRSEVKLLISKKRVFVNDEVIKKSDIKIDENLDIIKIKIHSYTPLFIFNLFRISINCFFPKKEQS